MTQDQVDFIEFLVDPSPDRGSQNDWCRARGIAGSTVTRWKKSRQFKEAWEARLAELNVAPDRIQQVINAVFAAATGGDVKAASLYLQYVDRFTPKQRQIIEDRSVADLSDEELAEQLEDSVRVLRAV